MNSKKRQPIVAIDGPSGAGKSTVARLLAESLEFTYIDTGAMYRCVGLAATRAGLPCEPSERLDAILGKMEIRFNGPATRQLVFLNGEQVTEAIRDHTISKAASEFSALPSVRAILVAMQRKMGQSGGVVMEGRDIGTNVFPDSEVKIYLDASAKERAGRRWNELKAKGRIIDFEIIFNDQKSRDENDMNRTINPLCKAEDAIVLDTSDLPIENVVLMLRNIVKKKQ